LPLDARHLDAERDDQHRVDGCRHQRLQPRDDLFSDQGQTLRSSDRRRHLVHDGDRNKHDLGRLDGRRVQRQLLEYRL
jgi:hypothetical protein